MLLVVVGQVVNARAAAPADDTKSKLDWESLQAQPGFFDLYWDDATGKLWLGVDDREQPFLYVSSLASGLGSNPVGLDRGQFGESRIVRFKRIGQRFYLQQENYKYRATAQSRAERMAVADSFAPSILFSAEAVEAVGPTGGKTLIDITEFLIRDAHDCIGTLSRSGQGTYQLAPSLSYVHMPRTKAFPDNTELEATLTFTAKSAGSEAQQTAADGTSITLRQHHAFVRLPDNEYKVRQWDPRVGAFNIEYADYSAAIDESPLRRLLTRHRLQKENPRAARSKPIEPVVYYVDSGAPQPIRDALIEGASWWNEAFERAGFIDGFRVEVLPEGVDPMDIRYNVIQWVHRATRGWSYGQSIVDPRTGEIIKGHVLLGSLRVRQDRLLFEGLSPTSQVDANASKIGSAICEAAAHPAAALAQLTDGVDTTELALARIRQLSAHEVGHTLGLAHNFAASTYADRASVMDYPAPRIRVADGKLDFSDAYGIGIGKWDEFAIAYAYSDFPRGPDADEESEARQLLQLVADANRGGLLYVSDADARPAGAAHPLASLWDDGSDPVSGLKNATEVRKIAINQFGLSAISLGVPLADLEQSFVPVYLHHRYQIEAAAKMLGGYMYSYAVNDAARPAGRAAVTAVPVVDQRRALSALLATLRPEQLVIPERILSILPPKPASSASDRERFHSQTSPVFDANAAARILSEMTIGGILQPERASRLAVSRQSDWDLEAVLEDMSDALLATPETNLAKGHVQCVVMDTYVEQLLELARRGDTPIQVQATVDAHLFRAIEKLNRGISFRGLHAKVCRQLVDRIEAYQDAAPEPRPSRRELAAPPGSPIGN